MPAKKPAAKPEATTSIANSTFEVTSPSTNEHDVAAVVAMSEAMKEIAIAMQKIADTATRSTVMNAPMIMMGGK